MSELEDLVAASDVPLGDSVEAVQEADDLTRDQVLAAVRHAAHVPIAQRVEVWLHAISAFLEHPSPGKPFELLRDGRVVEWKIRNL